MKKKISEVFGFPAPDNAVVEVRDDTAGSSYIPARNPEYVFRKEILSDFLAWVSGAAGNDPIYLTGSTGTGKSTTVEQVAAAIQQPLYVVSCHEAMEAPEFMGRYVVENGNMRWQDGPLVQGLKDPLGAWILIDEMDTIRPGSSMSLNAVIEGRNIIIPETGELLEPKKYGAKIICAGNTAGMDDETGMYAGTNRQNLALMGRFMMVRIDYPSAEDEKRIILGTIPGFPEDIAENMVKVANDIRRVHQNGETEVVFCTRALIRWGRLFRWFMKKPGVTPVYYSLERALTNKVSPEAAAGVQEMVQRVFGIANNAAGEAR